jgi:hypothetical protein
MIKQVRRPFLPAGPEWRPLRIAFAGLVIAVFGALIGVTGFATEQRWLWVAGYLIGVAGCAVSIVGVVYGWLTGVRRAITQGLGGALRLLADFWSRVLRRR